MKLSTWFKAFRDSPWFLVVLKASAGILVLGGLALVGMGKVRAFVPKAAEASPIGAPSARAPFASASAGSAPVAAPAVSGSAAPQKGPLVVLNTATEAELDKLPGIGPSTAARIIALRDKLGRFKRVEDLLRVKGIKRRLLAKIKPLIALDPIEPSPTASASSAPKESSR